MPGQIVRKPLRVRERSSRALDQRLSLRFPRLADVYLRLIGWLPPGSRVRETALWRAVRLLLEAFNRRDLAAVLVAYHPDVELHPAREFVEAGLAKPCYRGPAGLTEYMSDWSEVWGAELRIEPTELIDLGDRLVTLGAMPGRAQASGLEVTQSYAAVVTLKDGKAIHHQDFLNHAQALEAVGLLE